MMKPVATWFITATLALLTASDPFIGEYQLATTPLRARARVSDGFVSLFFEALDEPEDSVAVGPIRLIGGPSTYTVDYGNFGIIKSFIESHTGTSSIPQVQIQDGDLTTLTEYGPLTFKTKFQGKEVAFTRRALPLVAGTYVYTQGASFALILRVTTDVETSVEMIFRCDNAGRERQFQRTFRDLIVGELTNAQFGAGADYREFIDEVATGCSKSDLPTDSHTFIVFLATDYAAYLRLEGQPSKTFALAKIL
ncbi:hypothetical protein FOZ62_008299 [Perkinsus olseni]|uniref:Uncharacterized protein n=1 Tax=Perkinsus olseni TaxID=32597 RepID=A0A7J6QYD6_PEROL|nr:hypothetical protein FOZ62_008299 [Perkinsus olseni]